MEKVRVSSEDEKRNELKVCKRCKESYSASSNTSTSCQFHPSFFVCRRHDDQKRYYELGPDDPPYAAKFYDCCGAENVEAPGCTTSFHISYDDDQVLVECKSFEAVQSPIIKKMVEMKESGLGIS